MDATIDYKYCGVCNCLIPIYPPPCRCRSIAAEERADRYEKALREIVDPECYEPYDWRRIAQAALEEAKQTHRVFRE